MSTANIDQLTREAWARSTAANGVVNQLVREVWVRFCLKTQVVGGNFADMEGPLAGGSVVFQLSESGQTCAGVQVTSRPVTVTLDSTGNIPSSPVFTLWPNDQISNTRQASFYYMSVYSALGQSVLERQIKVPTLGVPWNVDTGTLI